jgi:MFS transporter, FHS family, L-fucose permease
MTKSRMFVVEGKNLFFTFCLVSTLFLLWGFCNGMIDVMDKHFQEELHLSLSQSAWVQFAHYLGYFLMALPAGALARRAGYKGGIIAGLLIVALGGFWFLAATRIAMFWAFLLGVCILASGLTFLETVANPYASALGDERYAAARLNLAQSLNGLGWILGPIAGSWFFYSVDTHGRSTGSESLYIPYACVAGVVLILAVVFFFASVPDVRTEEEYPLHNPAGAASHSIWSRPHFTMAVLTQFLYVAAQAGIFSFFINYMTSQVPAIPHDWSVAWAELTARAGAFRGWLSGWIGLSPNGSLSITNKGAANLASLAFLLFLIGRIAGAGLMRKIPAYKVLAIYGVVNFVLSIVIFSKLGWLSVASVFMSYFFMSIMFPTIFALGIHGLGHETKRASAYLVMAIVGGAILPKLMGHIADVTDMSRSFVVPMVCFAFVAYYGFKWPKFNARG